MELILKKNEILDLGNGQLGLGITCLEGDCWLTQAGDSRDHILTGGNKFNNRKHGQLLVTALEDCRLMLTNAKETNLRHRLITDYRFAFFK